MSASPPLNQCLRPLQRSFPIKGLMVNQKVSFRLPAKLIKQIAAKAKTTGQTKTAVILEALTQAFSPPLHHPDLIINDLQHQLESLQAQVTAQSVQLAKLSQAVYSEDDCLHHRIATPEQLAASNSLKLGGNPIEAQPVEETNCLMSQMAQQSRMLNQILSVSPDLLISYDRVGRFTYVNPLAAQTLGCHPNDLLGKTCQEINLSSALGARLSAQQEVVFITQQPVYDEISLSTANGVRLYECVLHPIWTEDRQIDTVICIARDITQRKQAETALRELEERYHNLFELADDAIMIIDATTYQYLNANQNAARRLGYTRQELLQLSIDYIIAPTGIASIEPTLQALQAKGSGIFEQVHRCKDGTEIPVEVSGYVIEYGDRLAFQWFVRDSSKRTTN